MSNAWEVTTEDITNVLMLNGIDFPNFFDEDEFDDHVSVCMGTLDIGAIEHCALKGDSIDEQTAFANEEITEQLQQAHLV